MQKKYPLLENNRFVNYPGEKSHSFFWKSVCMYVRSFIARYRHKNNEQQRISAWHNASTAALLSGPLRATWIGHATFLIQIENFNVLTDPVFGNLSVLFKRTMAPGIELEKLPAIDAVVISHNHRDHLDEFSLSEILKRNPACQFFVPHGDKGWFMRRGIMHVTECMWWDTESIFKNNQKLTLQFLPAYHWSQRGLFDRNKSLWGSWLIQTSDQTVYFGGDTAYGSHFKNIAAYVPHIDLALLPIGPCEPYEWMKFSHMNAEEAGKAFLDLQARAVMPMHWGTYRFGTDSIFAPLDRFTAWWQKHERELGASRLYAPACGKAVIIPSSVQPAAPELQEKRELQQ